MRRILIRPAAVRLKLLGPPWPFRWLGRRSDRPVLERGDGLKYKIPPIEKVLGRFGAESKKMPKMNSASLV
jgi:hypothetical protein